MKCPYCEDIMEEGVIQSPHELSWQEKKRFFNKAEFHENAVLLSKISIIKGSTVIANLCRKCGKIIIDYKDANSDLS